MERRCWAAALGGRGGPRPYMPPWMAALLLFAACAAAPEHLGPSISPSPATPWNPPASAVPPALPSEVLPAVQTPLTLEHAVDVALTNNPATRTAWLEARAAEETLGSRRSAYFPEIDLNASYTRSHQATQGGRTIIDSTTYGPSLALTYLLFDFGGRAAQVEQARQTLIAADYTHNEAIQDVVLQTEQAFYGVLDAKALLDAQAATLKERQANVDAADARHRAGAATIADLLQAQTAFSQAQLNYETIEGGLHQQQGLLATTMGIPVTTPLDVGALPADVPVQAIAETVDTLIARAVTDRPDLASARAIVERSRARVREVRSDGLPTFGLTANAARTHFSGAASITSSPYSIGVAMRFPLFTGFQNTYDLRQARTEVEISTEDARNLQHQVALQVWSSYYALATAAQRVRTSRDLLNAAQQATDVASGRYRNGVGSILDLLTSESALEAARAQEVQARADWLVAVAQLAHDTGTLGPQPGEKR